MKRLVAYLLILIMAFSLVACGNDSGDGGDAGTTPPDDGEIAPENTVALLLQEGGLGDEGWNDSAYAGLQYCMETYGVGGITAEATGAADAELFIRELAEVGYGLIICLDTSIMLKLMEIAADYPDQLFVVLSKMDLTANSGNVVKVWYQLNEHPFLAGVAAAFVATDGNEIVDYAGQNPGATIGMIFPTESNGFYRYGDGFSHGAKWYNENVELLVDYSTGFNDAALCQTIAENMIVNQKADVLWMCAGTSGLGGLQACRINGALGIGVDSNQDNVEPGYVLTSAVRNTDQDIVMIVESWFDGALKGSNPIVNVASGGLGITDMSVIAGYVTNQEKYDELMALLEDVKQKIISGEIRPYDTAETAYFESGEIVRFETWWEANKDTNPNNIHDWTYESALVYE